jgi:ParB-like chromosome segregation protein Spo0J
VAVALRKGLALPPVQVVEGSDGYYLVDGRHRVSVALATGQRDIEARIA